VLGILPIGVGAAMYSLNKDYILTLVRDPTGPLLLGAACVGMLVGFVWMRQTIKVEI
jgi:tight adherence protein B